MDSNHVKSLKTSTFTSGFSDDESDDGIVDNYEDDFLTDSSNDSSKDFLRKTKPLQTTKESFHSNDVKSRLKHEVSNDDDDFRNLFASKNSKLSSFRSKKLGVDFLGEDKKYSEYDRSKSPPDFLRNKPSLKSNFLESANDNLSPRERSLSPVGFQKKEASFEKFGKKNRENFLSNNSSDLHVENFRKEVDAKSKLGLNYKEKFLIDDKSLSSSDLLKKKSLSPREFNEDKRKKVSLNDTSLSPDDFVTQKYQLKRDYGINNVGKVLNERSPVTFPRTKISSKVEPVQDDDDDDDDNDEFFNDLRASKDLAKKKNRFKNDFMKYNLEKSSSEKSFDISKTKSSLRSKFVIDDDDDNFLSGKRSVSPIEINKNKTYFKKKFDKSSKKDSASNTKSLSSESLEKKKSTAERSSSKPGREKLSIDKKPLSRKELLKKKFLSESESGSSDGEKMSRNYRSVSSTKRSVSSTKRSVSSTKRSVSSTKLSNKKAFAEAKYLKDEHKASDKKSLNHKKVLKQRFLTESETSDDERLSRNRRSVSSYKFPTKKSSAKKDFIQINKENIPRYAESKSVNNDEKKKNSKNEITKKRRKKPLHHDFRNKMNQESLKFNQNQIALEKKGKYRSPKKDSEADLRFHQSRITKKDQNPLYSLLSDDDMTPTDIPQQRILSTKSSKNPKTGKSKIDYETDRRSSFSQYNEFSRNPKDLLSDPDSLLKLKQEYMKNKVKNQRKEQGSVKDERSKNGLQSKYFDYLLQDPALVSSKTSSDNHRFEQESLKDSRTDKSRSYARDRRIVDGSDQYKHAQSKSTKNKNVEQKDSYQDFLSTLPSFDNEELKSKNKMKQRQQSETRKKEILHELYSAANEDDHFTAGDGLLSLFKNIEMYEKPVRIEEDEEETQVVKVVKKKRKLLPKEIFTRRVHEGYGEQTRPNSTPLSYDQYIAQFTNRSSDEEAADHPEKIKKEKSCRRVKSGKKKPKLPAEYHGLGSLSALQELRHFNSGSEKIELSSTTDLRSLAYMQWLADREKKLRKRRSLKTREEEKENEEKIRLEEEKVLENERARRAWKEKKELMEEKIKEERRADMRRRRQERKMEEEEEFKSSKRAEVARKRLNIAAKERYKIEMKTKKEEEMIRAQKEEDKKRETDRAFKKWNEKRCKVWENERKREIRDQRKKEEEKLLYEEEKKKKADENFQKWELKKRLSSTGRINYHEEEKPPWNPPRKYYEETKSN